MAADATPTFSPAPGTDDPAPSCDPAPAPRLVRLAGIRVSGAAPAGPVAG